MSSGRSRQPSEASAWHVFDALRRAASRDFASITPQLRKRWAELEDRIEQERIEVEAQATQLVDDADEMSDVLSGFMQRTVDTALAMARELARSLD